MSILAAFVSMSPGEFGVFDNEHQVPVGITHIDLRGITDGKRGLFNGSSDVYCTTKVMNGYPNFSESIPISATFLNGNANGIPCYIDLSNIPSTTRPIKFYVDIEESNMSCHGEVFKIAEFNKPPNLGSYGFTIPAESSVAYRDAEQYTTCLTCKSAEVNPNDLYTIVFQLNGVGMSQTGSINGILGANLNGYNLPVNLGSMKKFGTIELFAYIVNETTQGYAISVALGRDAQRITIIK
jgi:hypothetical protein